MLVYVTDKVNNEFERLKPLDSRSARTIENPRERDDFVDDATAVRAVSALVETDCLKWNVDEMPGTGFGMHWAVVVRP
jgi:hypothetical protein